MGFFIGGKLRQGIDDRPEVGAAVAEKIFDAFAMFSPNGKKLVFCSNRNNGGTHDTNIFIADWVE